jgi:E-phenylitaconyl-CoA hydratase
VTEVVPRERLWAHAHSLAAEIASRRPLAIQGTVRAVWESLDLPATAAKRMGLSYPQRGNDGGGPQLPAERKPPRLR